MFFSVSHNETQWTLDFLPDSVTIIVKDKVQDLTISCLELLIAAFNSLMNQRQQFLDNHLAGIPITTNQQGTWEMQDEVRASVGDHDVSSDFVPRDWTMNKIKRMSTSQHPSRRDPCNHQRCLDPWAVHLGHDWKIYQTMCIAFCSNNFCIYLSNQLNFFNSQFLFSNRSLCVRL